MLNRITDIKDDAQMMGMLQNFLTHADALAALVTADVTRQQRALEQITAPALAAGLQGKQPIKNRASAAGVLRNGDVAGHDFHGNQWTGGSGSAGIKRVVEAAANPQDKSWEDWGDVSPAQAERYQQESGLNLQGFRRVIAADEVRKILRDHAKDAIPVTPAQLERLPEITTGATHTLRSVRPGKLERLISIKPEQGHVVVVEEVRTGRKKLAVVSVYNHPAKDPEKVIRALRAITNRVSVGQTAVTDPDQPSDLYLILRRELVNL